MVGLLPSAVGTQVSQVRGQLGFRQPGLRHKRSCGGAAEILIEQDLRVPLRNIEKL